MPLPVEVRFETPPGEQAQVDLARFEVEFTGEPGVRRIVWLFSMVLGHSRLIWARFVVHQDLQSVLRCHIAALEALGGVPREILYDRMKTAVIGEDPDGLVIYNRALLDLAQAAALVDDSQFKSPQADPASQPSNPGAGTTLDAVPPPIMPTVSVVPSAWSASARIKVT